MIVRYTIHALKNLTENDHTAFGITETLIESVMENPEREDYSRRGQIIAQRSIDEKHVLRVVYKCEFNYALVITSYVGRRKQYER